MLSFIYRPAGHKEPKTWAVGCRETEPLEPSSPEQSAVSEKHIEYSYNMNIYVQDTNTHKSGSYKHALFVYIDTSNPDQS